VGFIPKYKKKAIFSNPGNVQDERFREFATQKEDEIPVAHAVRGHVRMLACIPPKYSVSQVVRCIKGRCAIWIARNYYGRQQNYMGRHFRAHCLHVSAAGAAKR
jgi:putative transposase